MGLERVQIDGRSGLWRVRRRRGVVGRIGRGKRSWRVYEGLGSVPRKKTAAHVVGEDVGGVLFGGVEIPVGHFHECGAKDVSAVE